MALDQRDKHGQQTILAAGKLLLEQSDEPDSVEVSGLPREVYALLAQSNLLRMRGEWDAAVLNCMAALRLAPDSPSAQSLLGDIYEDQGRYDDAIQWRRMALDINPDSPANQMKLDRLLGLQKKTPHRSRQPQNEPTTPLMTAPQPTPNTDRILRLTAMIAALLVLLVVAFAYVSIHRHAALASLGLASDQEVKTPMVVLPANNTSNPAETPAEGAYDTAEWALLETLRASQSLKTQGITIRDAQVDPRSAAVQLTFSVTLPSGGSPSRDAVLRAAFLTARAAVQAPLGQTAKTITVRCLLTSAGTNPATSLTFVGDLPRNSLFADMPLNAESDKTALAARFLNPWWSSQIPN